jgi:hypothetical protein
VGQAALAVGGLLRENVAFERVLALDLASAGQLESLLGAGFGLHLRHGTDLLFELLFLFGRSNQDKHALSFEVGKCFNLSEVGYILRQLEEQQFTLLFVDDGAAAKEHKALQLGPFFQELSGVL